MSKSRLTLDNVVWPGHWGKSSKAKKRARERALVPWGLLAIALLGTACGSRTDDEPGGESHFLASCETTCDRGLTCIDHLCTRECSEQDDCEGLASDAVCADSPEGPACSVESAAPCEEGGLNHALGERWECDDGCNTCTCTEDGVLSTAIACGPTCNEGGETHVLGDTWTCSDGCNTCACTEDGLEQTLLACEDTCEDNGETYQVGDTWPCSDNCNTCSCAAGGEIARTDEACPRVCAWEGNDYTEGDIVELGTGVSCVCLSTGEFGQCTGAILDGGPTTSPEGGPSSEPCSYGDRDYQRGDVVDLGMGATCICLYTGLLGQCTGAISEGDSGTVISGGTPSPDAGGDICTLPPDSGDCEAAIPAIYFDPQSGQCLQFIYGGCGGNGNRFDSNGECYAACGRDGG